jgi:hypothetical protein
MYWKISEYPEFRDMPSKEQMRILKEALKANDPWAELRFWVVIGTTIGIAGLVGILFQPTKLVAIGIALLGPTCLYCYLLWDINGPARRSVLAYLASQAEEKTSSEGRSSSLNPDGPEVPEKNQFD